MNQHNSKSDNNSERNKKILSNAIDGLRKAINEMERATFPEVPLPRPRKFRLTDGCWWPYIYRDYCDFRKWCYYRNDGSIISYQIHDYVGLEILISKCGNQPRKVERLIRQIEAATLWCYARVEGRHKMADEIVRQQRRWEECLEARATLEVLK